MQLLAAGEENSYIHVVFKNNAPRTDCISEINNKLQIDNTVDINAVMTMFNLIRYGNKYLKISGKLLQYYTEEPPLNDNDFVINFPSTLFKFRQKILDSTVDDGKLLNDKTKMFKVICGEILKYY